MMLVSKRMDKGSWKYWHPTSSLQTREQMTGYNLNGEKWSNTAMRTSSQQSHGKWGKARVSAPQHGSCPNWWRTKWITSHFFWYAASHYRGRLDTASQQHIAELDVGKSSNGCNQWSFCERLVQWWSGHLRCGKGKGNVTASPCLEGQCPVRSTETRDSTRDYSHSTSCVYTRGCFFCSRWAGSSTGSGWNWHSFRSTSLQSWHRVWQWLCKWLNFNHLITETD